jgi:hypothetical protein
VSRAVRQTIIIQIHDTAMTNQVPRDPSIHQQQSEELRFKSLFLNVERPPYYL